MDGEITRDFLNFTTVSVIIFWFEVISGIVFDGEIMFPLAETVDPDVVTTPVAVVVPVETTVEEEEEEEDPPPPPPPPNPALTYAFVVNEYVELTHPIVRTTEVGVLNDEDEYVRTLITSPT